MYRTKTYVAGDWTGDNDAINKLYEWKNNRNLNLEFVDAHEFTQARDSSLPCSIKKSLRERLMISKAFVLIVGCDTKNLTKGSCRYCDKYNASNWLVLYGISQCASGNNIDHRSFIEYECEMAVKDYNEGRLKKIIVLYNSTKVDRSKCPESIKNYGIHESMLEYHDGRMFWKYQKIKELFMDVEYTY